MLYYLKAPKQYKNIYLRMPIFDTCHISVDKSEFLRKLSYKTSYRYFQLYI